MKHLGILEICFRSDGGFPVRSHPAAVNSSFQLLFGRKITILGNMMGMNYK